MTVRPNPRAAATAPDAVCRLCGSVRARVFADVGSGLYCRCPDCGLVFQVGWQLPDGLTEHGIYTAHENRVDDPGYRRFLARLAEPLIARLPAGASGLDYGAGPGPALADMLTGRGFPTAVYDPFFAPDEAVLQHRYGFIVCTETAEHFHHPGREFERLAGLLQPAGILAVMTRLFEAGMDFDSWWYHRDPTHVCFYSMPAFEWLGRRYGWQVERVAEDVVFLRAF